MLQLNPKSYNIILASQSPRRKELLKKLGFKFQQLSKNIEESYPSELEVEKVAEYLSKKKASVYVNELAEKDLLITSDTTVCLNNLILGKVSTSEEAIQMLQQLSGKEHFVITGVCLSSYLKQVSFSVKTKVKMKELSMDEITFYVSNFRPFDKAGAYGIQEWIGFIGVESIEGSFYNVMGLPVKELYEQINDF